MKFSEEICLWYAENKRNLDWRRTKDPYKIWLSEVILQQTQVTQATPYYNKFIQIFPDVFALAQASEDQILKVWQGLGYYSRARNLHATAKRIAFEHSGKFPNTYAQLLTLKGVGDYTASAIASICFGEAHPVVDGNVYRVLTRFFGIATPINSTEGAKQLKALANSIMDRRNIGEYNQAIMEFGALQCKPKSPNCSVCPLVVGCVAYTTAKVGSYPVKIRAKPVKKRYFNYIVFLDKNRHTLFYKREAGDIWQNLYEFPLIETPKIAKESEITGALGRFVKTTPIPRIQRYADGAVHKLSHQHLHTTFWKVNLKDNLHKGISLLELPDFPVPVLISNFIAQYLS